MVEATFYFPMVLMVVFFILMLSIIQLNQYIMNYEASRVADMAAMEIQYDDFDGLSDSTSPSMAAGLAELPSEGFYTQYYVSRQNSQSYLGENYSVGSYASLMNETSERYNILGSFMNTSSSVSVDPGFTDYVTVRVDYELKCPQFIKYITGQEFKITGASSSSKVAIRPTSKMRRFDAMDAQCYNWYGGNNYLPSIRYSNSEFDSMAAGGARTK